MPRTAFSDLAMRIVGEEVRRARQAAGLTQSELSVRLNATSPYISNVEAGRVNLTVSQLARIADALGCDLQLALPRIDLAATGVRLPERMPASAQR